MVLGRLQSLSSVILGGGPDSPLLTLPNRLPGRSPSVGAAGRNLLPMCQLSSVSAGPGGGASRDGGPRRRKEPSESCEDAVEVRAGGRAERQSEALSETEGGGGSRGPAPGPSKRRREPSREDGRSGRGPSRLQLLANLGSSSNPPPPKPERSFSVEASAKKYGTMAQETYEARPH